ncbi:MAG: ATP-dependent Clp protease proteolytic subunit 1 [Dehalococcoidia bacterium]|nr:ATP-dependent Clp protease proteolytic subunit 1 [Chloroflexota bacterium]
MTSDELNDQQQMITLPNPIGRELFFTKDVDQDSIGTLAAAIIRIQNNDEYLEKIYSVHNLVYRPFPIRIYIDSYGGDAYACFGLLSVIESCTTPIHTIVTGSAMSAGFLIAIHGHQRFAYPKASLMYHVVSSGAMGTIADMEENLTEMRRLQDAIEEYTLEQTKITPAKLNEIYKSKQDWYLSADDALKFGCIDAIIGVKKSPYRQKGGAPRQSNSRARKGKLDDDGGGSSLDDTQLVLLTEAQQQ